MKTAISVPDDVFEEAEALAKALKRSRSEIYSTALAEYLARHSADRVREKLDAVIQDVGAMGDKFVTYAARRRLKTTEW